MKCASCAARQASSAPGSQPGTKDTHTWDASSVAALDAIETKYAERGKTVEIVGLNAPSARLHGTLSGELAAGH